MKKTRRRIAAIIVGTAVAGSLTFSHIHKAMASTKAPVSIRRNLQIHKQRTTHFISHRLKHHRTNKV